MKWQPIETAPKDGTEFRARGRDWGMRDKPYHYVTAHWGKWGYSGHGWLDKRGDRLEYLTDWMPLPDAPSLAE